MSEQTPWQRSRLKPHKLERKMKYEWGNKYRIPLE